ncbi:MAG: sporulation protein YunB [Oscillospiraceae bacterium]
MIKKIKHKRSSIGKFKICAIILLAFLTFAFIFVDLRLRPLVVTMAQYRTHSLVTQAVNEGIINQLSQTKISYDDLVNVHKDKNGEVNSITYNSLKVNQLKSEIISAVIEETDKIDEAKIYIRIGNITNIDILQNKGPRLEFTITPSTYVVADIESDFQNTGINQVNHQIFIVLQVFTSALVPNYTTSVKIENKVCVAQTIIIGKVPNNIGNSVINPPV